MKKQIFIISTLVLFLLAGPHSAEAQQADSEPSIQTERRITLAEYRDKMMGGWVGQMVGVGWGAPTEFRYKGTIIPEDEVPEWKPSMVNVYGQDDLYVEMTFLRSMEEHGFDVSLKQAGIDFANSGYLLWHANMGGRDNLRAGIAPPNSGHPAFNIHADDIDYQIEADFSGLISPGMANSVIALGEKFGRIMNYGDGLYGGQFVGAMYAEAFFENDPAKLVEAGLRAIPAGSQYAEAVRDVIQWHSKNPEDWEVTWELVNEKYHLNPEYRKFSCAGSETDFNIDAKINAAYIVIGMLYGEGDYDQTTIISMRCGQDSDCNPSSAAGVLFTTVGYSNLPERFVSALDVEEKFSFTEYSFPMLIDVCEQFAIEAVKRAGGRVELNADGEKELVIPIATAVPSALEQSWEPGPVSDVTFSKAELRQIKGNRVYKYSLLLLLALPVLLIKDNRSKPALMIFIPVIMGYLLLKIMEMVVPKDWLQSMDIIIVYMALSLSMAIMLLLEKAVKLKKWYVQLGLSILVFSIVGFVGMWGASEGRMIALTESNLNIYAFQAVAWILGIILAVLLSRNFYNKVRFHLTLLGSFFLAQVIALLAFALMMMGSSKGEFFGALVWILGAGLVFMIIQYILTVPYLILAYKNAEYASRLKNLLGIETQESA